MKDRSRDSYGNLWPQIKPVLDTSSSKRWTPSAMDALKRALPSRLGPKSVNNPARLGASRSTVLLETGAAGCSALCADRTHPEETTKVVLGVRARPVLGRDVRAPTRMVPLLLPLGPTRASTAQPPCARAPLGRKPSGDQRALHQGCTSAARTPFGAKHARLRAPWIGRTAAFGGGIAACCSTAWHPQGTEQKERHLAHSLSARLRWLRGPVTHSVVRWNSGCRWRS